MTIDTIEDETTNLKIHASICAERYKGIEETFERVHSRMDSLETKVDTIHRDVTEGNRSMRNIVIGSTVTIVLSIIGLIVC